MNDSELILNPATNRFVKRSSQTGKRLIKQLSMPSEPTPNVKPYVHEPTPEPVQTALLQAGAEIVAEQPAKFKHLSPDETDELFKRLLLERLSISKPKPKPKKKASKYRVVSSDSESSE
jgi:hypothetical protein